jgi:hypothetical protein
MAANYVNTRGSRLGWKWGSGNNDRGRQQPASMTVDGIIGGKRNGDGKGQTKAQTTVLPGGGSGDGGQMVG